MTSKRFRAVVNLSRDFLDADPETARSLALDVLKDVPLRGPRGGRYLRSSDPYSIRDLDDPTRDTVSIAAFVDGQYVRPRRK